ncbi:hypothetical protein EJ04DRAFT_578773 [Polyplosphaeria fusca]|uniref:Uncharacterized protein n=1 Tax=Polyplosphaeria fusca TaxID=682080 RepID=A0A9P4QVX2_9PLEO|nr:hypothetical protein EJ04DRAFT_578773 [Polyplosphaeria fusca]
MSLSEFSSLHITSHTFNVADIPTFSHWLQNNYPNIPYWAVGFAAAEYGELYSQPHSSQSIDSRGTSPGIMPVKREFIPHSECCTCSTTPSISSFDTTSRSTRSTYETENTLVELQGDMIDAHFLARSTTQHAQSRMALKKILKLKTNLWDDDAATMRASSSPEIFTTRTMGEEGSKVTNGERDEILFRMEIEEDLGDSDDVLSIYFGGDEMSDDDDEGQI